MRDTEQKRIKAICEVDHVDDIGDLSDGYHTFNELYYQRMMLFAALVKQNRGKAWKSLRHSDGELCFGGGWFIVGIDTPEGCYTYHYEDTYFDLFDCVELERGETWDGHTEKDVTRLLSLEQEHCDDAINRQELLKAIATWDKFGCDANTKLVPYKDDYVAYIHYDDVITCINGMPPVAPQPKTGHWIDKDGNSAVCSCCNKNNTLYGDFCKSCGAIMVESQEEVKE